ncbi:MAG: ATP synthase F0 subunit B [Holophagaceae bacterium]|nr:ATP synthase F0 subunit B [Holophagaceae bacterium]
MALLELANLTLRSPQEGGPVARILAQMPDPMRPDLPALLFVVVLLLVLYFYLRVVFFQPITKVMEDRDRDLNAGGDAKAQAAAALEARQKDYQARLKELRAQAFERCKALSDAAGKEKQRLLDEARTQALAERQAAVDSLKAQQATAKQNLLAQVDALAESMAQTLLKQA